MRRWACVLLLVGGCAPPKDAPARGIKRLIADRYGGEVLVANDLTCVMLSPPSDDARS